jgi:hypothetical protein
MTTVWSAHHPDGTSDAARLKSHRSAQVQPTKEPRPSKAKRGATGDALAPTADAGVCGVPPDRPAGEHDTSHRPGAQRRDEVLPADCDPPRPNAAQRPSNTRQRASRPTQSQLQPRPHHLRRAASPHNAYCAIRADAAAVAAAPPMMHSDADTATMAAERRPVPAVAAHDDPHRPRRPEGTVAEVERNETMRVVYLGRPGDARGAAEVLA